MDQGYDTYCLADPDFYDSPARLTQHRDDEFPQTHGTVPDGWQRALKDNWVTLRPDDARLAEQGWKIHVSACPDNAARVLDRVAGYCLAAGLSFKFLGSRRLVHAANFKYAARSASGKFITVYPAADRLERTLVELQELVGGEPGPYILSDLRWADGPLYVRYGGFQERYCVTAAGRLVPAVLDPAGRPVPDRRGTAFSTPDWVDIPEFLGPHISARSAVRIDSMPYQIDAALHFSNGGGIYTATADGHRVILKEARPYAGLDAEGNDAVSRLEREHDILRSLSGLDCVPAVRDHFELSGHHFLVQDFADGEALSAQLAARYPLSSPDPDPDRLAAYTDWAVDACRRAEAAVAALHERGIVFGDLHPNNVLLRDDGGCWLIDFEVAARLDEHRRPSLGDPGFTAPEGRTGHDIDRYALACLRLHVFLPLTTLLHREPGKATQLANAASELFGADPRFLAPAVSFIQSGQSTSEYPELADWPSARDSMAAAIRDSATPERDDRLFPGDVQQFATGGVNLAYGAAGVLYALAAVGIEPAAEHERWLLRRAADPPAGSRLGLYHGLTGVAYVLSRLGHAGPAADLLDRCLAEDLDALGLDLADGLAGIGLALLHAEAATGERGYHDAACRLAARIADRLGPVDAVPTVSGGDAPYAGLLRGSAGCALLLVRLYQRTGDAGYLDVARAALAQDLRRCVTLPDSSIQVNEGWRTMPYLATGSAGIGLAAEQYLAVRADDELADRVEGIRRAARAPFYVQSGLFNGRAGMIAYLAHCPASGDALDTHRRRLAWHAHRYRSHLAFPGDQLLRLSSDLATGGAGVLLALGAAYSGRPVWLPGLEPLAAPIGTGRHRPPPAPAGVPEPSRTAGR